MDNLTCNFPAYPLMQTIKHIAPELKMIANQLVFVSKNRRACDINKVIGHIGTPPLGLHTHAASLCSISDKREVESNVPKAEWYSSQIESAMD